MNQSTGTSGSDTRASVEAIIDGFTRRSPERIDTALAKTDVFMARRRRISAEAVHCVALALSMQADAASAIHEFSEECLAGQCRMSDPNVRTARQVRPAVRQHVARSRGPGDDRRPDMVSGPMGCTVGLTSCCCSCTECSGGRAESDRAAAAATGTAAGGFDRRACPATRNEVRRGRRTVPPNSRGDRRR